MQSFTRPLYRQSFQLFARRSLARQFSAPASLPLRDRLKNDLKTAMKSKNALQAKVIRSVISEVNNAEKATPEKFGESTVMSLIQKGIAQRTDSAAQYTSAGREDLASSELEEKEILVEYLPTQLTEAEIDSHLKTVLAVIGENPQVGKVMKAFYETVDRASVKGDFVASRAKALLTGSA